MYVGEQRAPEGISTLMENARAGVRGLCRRASEERWLQEGGEEEGGSRPRALCRGRLG